MISALLQELDKRLAEIGRGAVFVSVKDTYTPGNLVTADDTVRWDPSEPLYLAHLGTNEEPIEPTVEQATSELTFPEYTGPLAHERYYDGESITLTVPLHYADPRLMAITSPTGTASGGYGRQRKVTEHTVVVFPEQFLAQTDGSFGAVTYDGTWEIGGVALNTEQTRLLGLSFWGWRGSWGRQLPEYVHADGGKTIRPCEFSLMYHPDMPDGHRAFTIGDPNDEGIDLLGAS